MNPSLLLLVVWVIKRTGGICRRAFCLGDTDIHSICRQLLPTSQPFFFMPAIPSSSLLLSWSIWRRSLFRMKTGGYAPHKIGILKWSLLERVNNNSAPNLVSLVWLIILWHVRHLMVEGFPWWWLSTHLRNAVDISGGGAFCNGHRIHVSSTDQVWYSVCVDLSVLGS